jgi:hypothetical protein
MRNVGGRMKRFLSAIAYGAFALCALAQDPAAPLPEQPAEEPPRADEPMPLIPETPPVVEKKAEKEHGSRRETLKAINASGKAEDLALKVRYREVHTMVLQDPAVQEERQRANRAPTEYEKREALTRHYRLISVKMEKIDPSLKTLIELRESEILGRLKQTRIEPTHPPTGYTPPPPLPEISAGEGKKRP